jgi:alpha-tubulin suppressor-like RCC1 family protein
VDNNQIQSAKSLNSEDSELEKGEDGAINKLVDVKFEKVTHLSMGDAHTIVVTENGYVYSFGLNSKGQCGQSSINCRIVKAPTKISQLRDYFCNYSSCGPDCTFISTRAG